MRWTAAGHLAKTGAALVAALMLLACGSSEPPPPVATVTLSPANDTIAINQTTQLSATLQDADGNILNGRALTWASGSPNVATISQTGLVTGVADGTAIITVTSENKTASASIRVFNLCSTALAATITVGQTVNGSLASTDCRLDDDTFADGYALSVPTATNVQIDMTATFDTYLVLFELVGSSLINRSFNDDLDPDDPNDPNDTFDTNSRITFALQPNVQYFVLANSFDPNVFGSYQLKVAATPFIAGASVAGKPGKAPIEKLMKALKVPK